MSDTVKALLAKRTRPTRTQPIYFDGAAASEAQQLREEHAKRIRDLAGGLTLADGDLGLDVLKEQIEDATARARDSAVIFKFEALSRLAFEELLAQHPDPDDPRANFNDKTFPAALIAASCVEPVLTVEDVAELFDELSDGEVAALWSAAWNVQEDRPRPLDPTDTGQTLSGVPSLNTVSNTG